MDSPIANPVASGSPRDFRTTQWSVVLEAGGASEAAQSALEKLCRSYWYPLYGFLRRRGYDEHAAKDLTQEFFARLLAGASLQTVSPEKGRFRTFLLAALKNLLANEWRDARRLKRGGGREVLSWDDLAPEVRFQHEAADNATPEAWFDRQWAQTVVKSALDRLAREMDAEGLGTRYLELRPFLQGDGAGGSYASAAARLGLSEAATKTAIFRLRRRYGELIREEVMETVGTTGDVEGEIEHLIQVLSLG